MKECKTWLQIRWDEQGRETREELQGLRCGCMGDGDGLLGSWEVQRRSWAGWEKTTALVPDPRGLSSSRVTRGKDPAGSSGRGTGAFSAGGIWAERTRPPREQRTGVGREWLEIEPGRALTWGAGVRRSCGSSRQGTAEGWDAQKASGAVLLKSRTASPRRKQGSLPCTELKRKGDVGSEECHSKIKEVRTENSS